MRRVVATCAALMVALIFCLAVTVVVAQEGPIIPGLDSLPLDDQATPAETAEHSIEPSSPPARPQAPLLPARSQIQTHDTQPGTPSGPSRGLRPDPFEEPTSSRTAKPPRQSVGQIRLNGQPPQQQLQNGQTNRPADPRLRQFQQQQQLQLQLQQRANQQRQQADPRYGRPQQNVPTTRTGNPSTQRQAPQSMQRAPSDPRRAVPNKSAKKSTNLFGR